MEEGKSAKALTTSLHKLILNSKFSQNASTVKLSGLHWKKKEPPSLLSLCLGVVGKHFEDIIEDLNDISINFPADIKMAMASLARRRKLLSDDVIISLAESSWEILDISGSNVSDVGLAKIAEKCKYLRAVDISQCDSITPDGVYELVRHCRSLETLRCGGGPRSESTARRSLGIFIPKINNLEGDSWEELDTEEIVDGAQSLRWLVWPTIDKDSLESLSTECPRIIVNPKPSPFGVRGLKVPEEAAPSIELDHTVIKDIDPKTWAACGITPRPHSSTISDPTELSVAEKFRLAFVERDNRLAPKRAKNARQHERRAKRDWVMTSSNAKAIALASQATYSSVSLIMIMTRPSSCAKEMFASYGPARPIASTRTR